MINVCGSTLKTLVEPVCEEQPWNARREGASGCNFMRINLSLGWLYSLKQSFLQKITAQEIICFLQEATKHSEYFPLLKDVGLSNEV